MAMYEELSLDIIEGPCGKEVNAAYHTGNMIEIPEYLGQESLLRLLRKHDMLRGRIRRSLLEIDWQYTQLELRYKGDIVMILQKVRDEKPQS